MNPQNPRHSIGVALQAESDSLAISGVQNSDLSEDSLLHQEISSPQKDAEPLDVQGGADFSLPSTPRDENEILQNTLMTPQKADRRPHREEEVRSKKNDVFEPLDPHQYYNRGNTPFKKGVPYVLPHSKSNKMSIDCSDCLLKDVSYRSLFSIPLGRIVLLFLQCPISRIHVWSISPYGLLVHSTMRYTRL